MKTSVCILRTHQRDTYLFLLLVEVVNNDTNEEVEREERAKDDEDDKVNVHVEVDLIGRLLLDLGVRQSGDHSGLKVRPTGARVTRCMVN